MKKLKKYLTLILLVCTSVWAEENSNLNEKNESEGFSYLYYDIAHLHVNTPEESGNGYFIRGVQGVGNNFYLIEELGNADIKNGDFRFLRFGVGAHNSISEHIDGIVEITYEDLKTSEEEKRINVSGYGLAIGARILFTEKLEAALKVRHIDYKEKTELIEELEILYLVNHNFGFLTSIEHGDDRIWSIGIQFQF